MQIFTGNHLTSDILWINNKLMEFLDEDKQVELYEMLKGVKLRLNDCIGNTKYCEDASFMDGQDELATNIINLLGWNL